MGGGGGGGRDSELQNVLSRYHFVAPNHQRAYIPKPHSGICPLPTQLPSQNLHFKECSLISLRFKSISVVYVKLLQRAMCIASSHFGTRNKAGCADKSELCFLADTGAISSTHCITWSWLPGSSEQSFVLQFSSITL